MHTRTQAPKRGTGSRFARPGGTSTHRAAGRHQATPGRRPIMTRRKPQKSGMAKAMDTIGTMLPGKAKSGRGTTRGPGKGKSAGLAVLAGAAGLAVKNRGKLGSLLRGKRSQDETTTRADTTTAPAAATPPPEASSPPSVAGTPPAPDPTAPRVDVPDRP